MKVLTHYSPKPLTVLSRYSPLADNKHSPGGFWLSDDSAYGWQQFLAKATQINPNDWADAGEKWACQTHFLADTNQLLWIKTESEMHQFVSDHGEPCSRACDRDPAKQCYPGYGVHIEWASVKAKYKGILISPYQRQLSHHHRDPNFHWYRFDCASACVWDLSCLTPPNHISIVDNHVPRQPQPAPRL